MAARLVLNFAGTSGDVTMSYNYADTSVSASDIKNLMNTIITNGSIFVNPPVSSKSAKFVTTSETWVRID